MKEGLGLAAVGDVDIDKEELVVASIGGVGIETGVDVELEGWPL